MKIHTIISTSLLLIASSLLSAQTVKLGKYELQPVKVSLSQEKLMNIATARVVKDSSVQGANESTFAKLKGIVFTNGTIEVKLLSKLLSNASATARGFIGVAFRIDSSNEKYECIYIRPTNGRADDQIRRNHSVQYASSPDYHFDRLRKESPEKYESYADMGLNEWVTLKIEVEGEKARLYLNGNKQPCLIVNDLKHGANFSGGIGLWVDGGTDGYFADVKITPK
jgi:hypothetical protein